jgi:hypothetical protein
MRPGETVRLDCPNCQTEFEVCLEPKARDNPKEGRGLRPQPLNCCPFCGGTDVDETEDSEDGSDEAD